MVVSCVFGLSGCKFYEQQSGVQPAQKQTEMSEKYLFGEPPADTLKKWRKMCREVSNDDFSKWTIEAYGTTERMHAVKDLIGLFLYNHNGCIPVNDELIIWRLSEYMPMSQRQPTEYERFKKLDVQIDSVLYYDDWTQFSYNFRFRFEEVLQEVRARVMFKCLKDRVDSNIAELLMKEEESYWAYHKNMVACYDTVRMSPTWNGSAAGMAYARSEEDDVLIRAKSLEAFYYTLADGKAVSDKLEKHRDIPMTIITDEYRKFADYIPSCNSGDEDDYFPCASQLRCLQAEQAAFTKWMDDRERVSDALSGEMKKAFDRSTNNARRHKLFMLKNRYHGYEMMMDSDYEYLAKEDWPDRKLLRYNY